MSWLWGFWQWLLTFFWQTELEITLLGLQYSGKTTFLNLLDTGQYSDDSIPTVGFNMKRVTRGRVCFKVWDVGGQPRFRAMWEKYARGANVIIFSVAAKGIQELLCKKSLLSIPLLVLANKSDLSDAVGSDIVAKELKLGDIDTRDVVCMSISAKQNIGIENALEWVMEYGKA